MPKRATAMCILFTAQRVADICPRRRPSRESRNIAEPVPPGTFLGELLSHLCISLSLCEISITVLFTAGWAGIYLMKDSRQDFRPALVTATPLPKPMRRAGWQKTQLWKKQSKIETYKDEEEKEHRDISSSMLRQPSASCNISLGFWDKQERSVLTHTRQSNRPPASAGCWSGGLLPLPGVWVQPRSVCALPSPIHSLCVRSPPQVLLSSEDP